MIRQESIAQLKAVVDIVEVVGGYVELKREGVGYKAICPFHNEKTASFHVDPSKNTYTCYGCGVYGDAINFIRDYEGIGFYEAVEKLADRYGVEISYTHARPKMENSACQLLDKMATCYQEILARTPHALQYLKARGINEDSIAEFRLGYCDSRAVLAYVEKHRLDKEALHDLGVLGWGGEQGGTQYATLFNRIIFPIQSMNGAVVAFGGRTLEQGGVKYINSSASALFNKSKTLYGYFQARPHILEKQRIIITEGYIDVILAHQAGIKTAVATLGTALTSDHLPLLRPLKESSPIIMAYDMDRAGQEATQRAIELLCSNLKYGGVAQMPKGLDVADMVAQGKIQELKNALDNPIPFIDFSLKRIIAGYDFERPLDISACARECARFLYEIVQEVNLINWYTKWLKENYNLVCVPPKPEEPTEELVPAYPGNHNEEMILYILMTRPQYIEVLRPCIESKYFSIPENARTYEDLLAGRLNTPHQNALAKSAYLVRLAEVHVEMGAQEEWLLETALQLGKDFWVSYWRAWGDADDTGRQWDAYTHANLIEDMDKIECLQLLPLMHYLPSTRDVSVWGLPKGVRELYDPYKLEQAVNEHRERFGELALYSRNAPGDLIRDWDKFKEWQSVNQTTNASRN
ncbi:DNA primase [Helicobacter salomonis]|uniref:DNA primase n=1 Tax=Helicobacter salomonis TaxID=56878 RepID=UPI000CF137E2|nr:DNA primase [Helicobacter salomonis]